VIKRVADCRRIEKRLCVVVSERDDADSQHVPVREGDANSGLVQFQAPPALWSCLVWISVIVEHDIRFLLAERGIRNCESSGIGLKPDDRARIRAEAPDVVPLI